MGAPWLGDNGDQKSSYPRGCFMLSLFQNLLFSLATVINSLCSSKKNGVYNADNDSGGIENPAPRHNCLCATPKSATLWRQIRIVCDGVALPNRKSPKPQNYSRQSKFLYISYIFTEKLHLCGAQRGLPCNAHEIHAYEVYAHGSASEVHAYEEHAVRYTLVREVSRGLISGFFGTLGMTCKSMRYTPPWVLI
jgi:hypothetical protein